MGLLAVGAPGCDSADDAIRDLFGLESDRTAAEEQEGPTPPEAFAATPEINPLRVELSWLDSENEDGYRLERSEDLGDSFAELATFGPDVVAFTDDQVVENTVYIYRLVASNAFGEAVAGEFPTAQTDGPPVAPSGLIADAPDPNLIDLFWLDNSDDETEFRVLRRLTGAGTFDLLATLPPNSIQYTDATVDAATSYEYQVVAVDDLGTASTDVVEVTTPGLGTPPAPSGLSAIVGAGVVQLTWTDNSSDETFFDVQRALLGTGSFASLSFLPPDSTSFDDASVVPGVDYEYRVVALNLSGFSPPSNLAQALVPQILPTPPSGLVAVVVRQNLIDLSWTDNAPNEDGFRIERSDSGGPFATIATVGSDVTAYSDPTVVGNTDYAYRLFAFNSLGDSPPSNVVAASTPANLGTPNAALDLLLSATAPTQVVATWTDTSNDETGFRLERSLVGQGAFVVVATVGANVVTATDSNAQPNTDYDYRVFAFNANGDAPAERASISTPPAFTCMQPATPRDVSMPDHVIGTGTPGSVTEAALQAALNLGGTIVFDPGPSAITLDLTTTLMAPQTAVIDGGGLVRLDGNASRVIVKGSGASLVLQNLVIQNGGGTLDPNPPGGDIQANAGVGVLAESGGLLELLNVDFVGCVAPIVSGVAGGAVFSRAVQTYAVGCQFLGNRAASGGALAVAGGDLIISDCLFQNNLALGTGGLGATPPGGAGGLSGAGEGGLGGAVYLDDSSGGPLNVLDVCGTLFLNNRAAHEGGAVYVVQAAAGGSQSVFDRCALEGNAVIPGGNIDAMGTPGFGDAGGALVQRNGLLFLAGTTVAGNSADWRGGGVLFESGAAGSVWLNCTFAANQATLSGAARGGAMELAGGGTVELRHLSVGRNSSAFRSGGIEAAAGTAVTLISSLLADNTSTAPTEGQNLNRTLLDGGGNLQFPGLRPDGMPEPPATASVTLADPLFLPIADNGGPTRTLEIALGSPAVDAGTVTGAPVVDQRNRPRDAAPDAGAFERSLPLAPSDLEGNPLVPARVFLTWTDNADDELGYRVERQLSGVGPFAQIGMDLPADSTTFLDASVSSNTAYDYRVLAFNINGTADSSIVTVTTLPEPAVERYAGVPGMAGYNGEGMLAGLTRLDGPQGLALDPHGNLFVGDANNALIRRIEAGTTLVSSPAGQQGMPGFTGDGGAASAAQIQQPVDVEADRAGGVLFIDAAQLVIRRVDPFPSPAPINLIAGTPGLPGPYPGDGFHGLEPAPMAMAFEPTALALDPVGNAYVALGNDAIVRIHAQTGIVSTVVGQPFGLGGYNGDGPGPTTLIDDPSGLVVSPDGRTLYFVDQANALVRAVDLSNPATYLVTTLAGTPGMPGFAGDFGPATAAQLAPRAVAVDSRGNLYITEPTNHRLRRYDAATGLISTILGDGSASSGGDGGPASQAQIDAPFDVAIDRFDQLYVSDTSASLVRHVQQLSPLEILPVTVPFCQVGVRYATRFDARGGSGAYTWSLAAGVLPPGLALMPDPDSPNTVRLEGTTAAAGTFPFILEVMDGSLGVVQRTFNIQVAAPVLRTLTGDGADGMGSGLSPGMASATPAPDGTPASQALINTPMGMHADAQGNLYFVEQEHNLIRMIDTSGVLRTVAGNGLNPADPFAGDGGPATAADAQLSQPHGVFVDALGHVFIADTVHGAIRRVDAFTGFLETVAGNPPTVGFGGDGDFATAPGVLLGEPHDVAVDAAGSLYILNATTSVVRRVAALTGRIETYAGVPNMNGDAGDGGPATAALMNTPIGFHLQPDHQLIIADTLNFRIRSVDPGTGVISAFIGNGFGCFGVGFPPLDPGQFAITPDGIDVDLAGNIYYTPIGCDDVRRVNASSNLVERAIGTGNPGYAGEGGTADAVDIRSAYDVVVMPDGSIVYSGRFDQRVRAAVPP